MTAVPGTARMAMRIEVQERMPNEAPFHTVNAAGLGVWRGSQPGVKIYKYVKQVTNLSSPAVYRALVRFHWLDSKGYVIKRAARYTSPCAQPASAGLCTGRYPPVMPVPGATPPSATTSPSTTG